MGREKKIIQQMYTTIVKFGVRKSFFSVFEKSFFFFFFFFVNGNIVRLQFKITFLF